jgi:hypothetical protein
MPVEQQCRRDLAVSTSCAANNSTAIVKLCEMALMGMSDTPLVQTIMHEFAHIACNGNPQIASGGRAGGEVYYDGSRFPGNQSSVLNQADPYAWFALQAERVATQQAPAPPRPSGAGRGRPHAEGPSHAPWWAALGAGAALSLGALIAPGLLVGGILGLLIGGAGLLGLFD